MNPENAVSRLSPGMAECHARLMAVAKHGTPEAFSATLAGVLQRAELSISNAYDAGAKSIQVEAVAAPAAANEITKAFREYLTVHPSIKLGGHEADTVARELAFIAQPDAQPSSDGADDEWSKSEIDAAIKVNAPPCFEAVINPDVAATALRAYLKDCEDHSIVPDVGGAWHAAFLAGAASREKAPAGATQGPTVLVQREELQKLLSGQSNDDMHAMLLAFDPRFWDELGGHGPDLVGLYIQSTTTAQAAPAGATLPEGWVPLTITHEGQYPEEIAYGPQRMMDRLGKWLRKYFDFVAANKAQAAPAAGAVAGMPPGISALMCVISSLRDTAHFSDEEGELTDELRTLRDWAMTQAAAPTPAAQAESAPKAQFDDPKVQAVYAILCDDAEPPEGEHWEGFAARRIVDALSADSVLEDAARWRDWSQAFAEASAAPEDTVFMKAFEDAIGDSDAPFTAEQFTSWVDAARKQGGKHD